MKPNAWRPPALQTRSRWRLIHRVVPLAAFVGVAGLLLFLLAQPFWHPRIHLLFAAPDYRDARLDGSSPSEDLAAVHVPQISVLHEAKG